MSLDRRAVLAKFIRSQVALTDKHPHVPGPGSVHLNHEEATLAADALEDVVTVGKTLAEVEREHILATLAACEGDKKRTADVLGCSLKNLYNKLHEYGVMR